MYKVKLYKDNRIRRKLRVRRKILGTAEKPRMSVFRSNKYIYAQFIDDEKGKTLASASSNDKDFSAKKMKKSEQVLS